MFITLTSFAGAVKTYRSSFSIQISGHVKVNAIVIRPYATVFWRIVSPQR